MRQDHFKVFVLPYIIIFIVLSLVIYFLFFKPTHYETVRKESIEFLENNYIDLTKLCENLILEKGNKSTKYEGRYVAYSYLDGKEYVTVEIGAQGFLGGQYWGVIYSPNEDYLNGKNIEIYDEYKLTGDGNNIVIYEKIKNKWYFFYKDYDGKVDTSKIKY